MIMLFCEVNKKSIVYLLYILCLSLCIVMSVTLLI